MNFHIENLAIHMTMVRSRLGGDHEMSTDILIYVFLTDFLEIRHKHSLLYKFVGQNNPKILTPILSPPPLIVVFGNPSTLDNIPFYVFLYGRAYTFTAIMLSPFVIAYIA